MPHLIYTAADIGRAFDAGTRARGAEYFKSGMVSSLALSNGLLNASVKGSQRRPYHQAIGWRMRGPYLIFDGDCTCPMRRNCKHVVAALLAYEARQERDGVPAALATWVEKVAALAKAETMPGHLDGERGNSRLIGVLLMPPGAGRIELALCKGVFRANGLLGSATVLASRSELLLETPAYVTSEDRYVIALFGGLPHRYDQNDACVDLKGEIGGLILADLLDNERLYRCASRAALKERGWQLLAPGPSAQAGPVWRGADDGSRLVWEFDDGTLVDDVLPTLPPMYVRGGMTGPLELAPAFAAKPIGLLRELVREAPVLQQDQAGKLAALLESRGLGAVLPSPRALPVLKRRGVAMQACLWLGANELGDVAAASFDYDGVRCPIGAGGKLTRRGAGQIEEIARNRAAEKRALARLAQCGLTPCRGTGSAWQLDSPEAWVRFHGEQLPQLRAEGWRIDIDATYRYDLRPIDDWYADVEQGDGSAWFTLELGIMVEQVKIPLLPLLLELIKAAPDVFDPALIAAQPDGAQLLAALPNGTSVLLPWARLRPILTALGDLFFVERDGALIRLPALDAARLAELEAAALLRWSGAAQLLEKGRRLGRFGGIAAALAPAGLQAQLRPYQLEGLAWMQFLREYGVGGILADDMGLGKTLQTLAHILAEKEAGRLDAPALVVAPTSLMGNWQAEAARFTPGLRVLLLHGAERQDGFARIASHDLVLTTYALLHRDEAALRAQRFHLLILDESQYIKNARAKASQTAQLLQARHRLCLSGTPLQNHLGELWAQFHFLMPGLLGDEKVFNADFRKPIEKQGNLARNNFLKQRVHPFMLRRTKDLVATELPAKTEITREVALDGAQRDLYETVRLAMDKKVRDAIDAKGVARSQIVILEALLKLRQVCCDPRLVKSAAKGQASAASAKLEALLEMLAELLAEGRRVLVFSQFTSMLALIEAELRARAIRYALLTGDTVERGAQVDAFQSGAVPVFLISLKAGGVGLNLTAADTVIHYDPWWNPAAENQATDRAWRIGQDKPVFVYRLIARGTLEERIQAMQRDKKALADAILGEGALKKLDLSQADLDAIFAPLA